MKESSQKFSIKKILTITFLSLVSIVCFIFGLNNFKPSKAALSSADGTYQKVAHYEFNNSTNIGLDTSGNGYNLTNSGATYDSTNRAVNFGTAGFLYATNDFSDQIVGSYSLSFRIYATSNQGGGNWIVNTNGYDSGASVNWEWGGIKGAGITGQDGTATAGYIGGMFSSTAAWYRVYILYDNTNLTWSVIATKEGDSSYSINKTLTTTAISFGGSSYTFTLGGQSNASGGAVDTNMHISATNYTTPLLSDFRVYTGVIDSVEMAAIATYDANGGGTASTSTYTKVAHYEFNDSSNLGKDSSGLNRNLTNSGATYNSAERAVDFGTSGFLYAANDFSDGITGNYSLSFRIYATSTAGDTNWLVNTNGWNNGLGLNWHYGGFRAQGITGSPSYSTTTGYCGNLFSATPAWYRIHVLYDNTNLTWNIIATKDGDSSYSVNETLTTTAAVPFGGNTSYTFTLGGQATTTGGSLDGHISLTGYTTPLLSDFRVYTGLIDSAEMEAIAQYDIKQKEMKDTDLSMDQQVFANNMILQRNKPVEIYGKTGANKQVTVSFNGQVKTGTSDASGNFSIYLDAMSANATGQTLTVSTATATKTYTNVLIGEVFLGIGQSNMGYPLYEFLYGEQIIKSGSATTIESIDASQDKAKYNGNPSIKDQLAPYRNNASKLRFYMQQLDTPNANITSNTWLCPTTADFDGLASDGVHNYLEQVSFTAVAFATQLQAKLGVPVGVVVNAKGGTRVRQWLSPEAAATGMPGVSDSAIGTLYNSMTVPMGRYTYAGILWYQGESDIYDISAAANYVNACKALFNTYRAEQNDMELPVFVYQLPQFYGHNASLYWQAMRDLHTQLANGDENIHLISGIDTGDYCNIHPIDKMQLNERAVALALEKIYGQSYSGSGVWGEAPQISSILKEGNVLRLKFTNTTAVSIAQFSDQYAPSGGINVPLYLSTEKLVFGTNSALSSGSWVTCGAYWVSNDEIHCNLADAGFSASQIANFKYVSYAIENTYADNAKFIYNQYGVPVVPFTNAEISEKYAVTISATGGTTNISSAQVARGGSVTFTTSANEGYQFSKVLVNGVENNSIYSNGTVTLSNITDATTIEVVYAIKTFTITASATNGTVNSNSVVVDYNGTATINTSADEGYQFSKVLVNGTQNNAVYSNGTITIANVTANATIEVVYVIKTYQVSISATGATVNGNSTITVNHGESATFNLTPNANYELTSLKVNGTDKTSAYSNGTISLTNVTANTEIVVIFSIKTYQVSISATGATVNGNATITVNHGESATFNVTPTSGYELHSLTINGNENLSAYAGGVVTISGVTEATNVVIVFVDPYVPPTEYTVSITATGATVNGSNSISVVEGNSAVFNITPNANYEIKSLTVNGISNISAYSNGTVTIANVTENTNVVIEFAIKTYEVTIQSTGASVSSSSLLNVDHGANATFNVVPNANYELSSLLINGSENLSAYSNGVVTITNVTENTEIVIVFTLKTYQVSINVTGATLNGNSTITVNHGDNATFTLTPNANYKLVSLTINGNENLSAYSNGTITINSVSETTNIVVIFNIKTYTVSIQATGATVSGNTTLTVNHGESATFNVTPTSGYELYSLTINGNDSLASYSSGVVTIASVTEATNVVIVFIDPVVPPTEYTVSITATGATVNGNTTISVVEGNSAVFNITPNANYELSSLLVNGSENLSAYSNGVVTIANVTENIEIVIVFTEIIVAPSTFTVEVQIVGGIVNGNSSVEVVSGENAVFSITPNTAYTLSTLTINGVANLNAYSNGTLTIANVTEDTTVVITFTTTSTEVVKYTVKATFDKTQGSVSNIVAKVNAGTKISPKITAKTGYVIKSITINGKAQTITNDISMTIKDYEVNANTTIVVEFEAVEENGCGSNVNGILPVGIATILGAVALMVVKKLKKD